MPLVAWDDGSNRYLHVDVHKMEVYQVSRGEERLSVLYVRVLFPYMLM